MSLITIKTFDNSIDTHLMKSKLESEGIVCYIFDENMVTYNPIYNIAFGGIKLKINEQDLNKASNIIKLINESKITDENNEIIKCPKCNSEELYIGYKSMKGVKGVLSIIVSLIFMIFPIYYKTLNKCKICGQEFRTT